MVTALVRTTTLMDGERKTRAEPVTTDDLIEAQDRLRKAADNIEKVLERMERAKLDSLMLRWKTRRDSAKDWFVFSLGLDQAFESELIQTSSEKSGREAKERDRNNRGK